MTAWSFSKVLREVIEIKYAAHLVTIYASRHISGQFFLSECTVLELAVLEIRAYINIILQELFPSHVMEIAEQKQPTFFLIARDRYLPAMHSLFWYASDRCGRRCERTSIVARLTLHVFANGLYTQSDTQTHTHNSDES